MERKLFIIMLLSLMAMGAIDSKAQDFRSADAGNIDNTYPLNLQVFLVG